MPVWPLLTCHPATPVPWLGLSPSGGCRFLFRRLDFVFNVFARNDCTIRFGAASKRCRMGSRSSIAHLRALVWQAEVRNRSVVKRHNLVQIPISMSSLYERRVAGHSVDDDEMGCLAGASKKMRLGEQEEECRRRATVAAVVLLPVSGPGHSPAAFLLQLHSDPDIADQTYGCMQRHPLQQPQPVIKEADLPMHQGSQSVIVDGREGCVFRVCRQMPVCVSWRSSATAGRDGRSNASRDL